MSAGYRVELTVPAGVVLNFSDALEDLVEAVAMVDLENEAGEWRLEGYGEGVPDKPGIIAAIAIEAAALGLNGLSPVIEEVPWRDWLAENRRGFPPIRIGRYFLHGSHVEPEMRAGVLPILIDASLAFGSGEHNTTRGCLLSFERLLKRLRRGNLVQVLDMGCGTGVLGLAAAMTRPVRVLGVDIEQDAARISTLNARLNGVPAGRYKAFCGDGYKDRRVGRQPRYDLVFANILARPLCKMAPRLARVLKPGGHAILSGLLDWQEARVLAAHRHHGLYLADRIRLSGWSTLVLKRR